MNSKEKQEKKFVIKKDFAKDNEYREDFEANILISSISSLTKAIFYKQKDGWSLNHKGVKTFSYYVWTLKRLQSLT